MTGTNTIALDILLVDDDADIRETLGQNLSGQGHQVVLAENGAEALQRLESLRVDIVITDVRMPGMDGFELLATVRERWPDIEVIVGTAYGDVDNAVRALREGAFDFFTKPFNVHDIAASLQRTARYRALQQENERYRRRMELLHSEGRARYGLAAILGHSAAIERVKGLIGQVAASELGAVLVEGETGTGKELAARAIHYESARAQGPFIAVDCTAIPEQLIESELFGHAKGAFTDAREARTGKFELADGGTLFLDEIGDMAVEMQRKLLRTLEERKVQRLGENGERAVDVRVVSASNRDLRQAIEAGTFRADLYYRLNAIAIRMPPLRERPEDIRHLAEHFLRGFALGAHGQVAGFSQEALIRLENYAFPGNVRELRNMVERAAVLCQDAVIGAAELHFDSRPQVDMPKAPVSPSSIGDDELNLSAAEERMIRQALAKSGGSKAAAARLLGISRNSLRRRMARYGLE